jgi:transcriptional regulator with XRE-family HTH domain
MLSSRLKKLRIENHLTQEELGNKVNLKKSAISKYERGRVEPNIELVVKFAEIFNVSVDYLTCKTNNSEPIKVSDNTQKLSFEIHDLLIRKGIITKDEILTNEKIEWLRKLIGHAIDLSKM